MKFIEWVYRDRSIRISKSDGGAFFEVTIEPDSRVMWRLERAYQAAERGTHRDALASTMCDLLDMPSCHKLRVETMVDLIAILTLHEIEVPHNIRALILSSGWGE